MKFWLTCMTCSNNVPFALQNTRCTCGGILLVSYDLERVKYSMSKECMRERRSSLWRYEELLPINDRRNIVSLGEGWTPLIRLSNAEQALPLRRLWVKREEQNPAGSFKARGFALAVTLAKLYGKQRLAVHSNGNAGAALAAYASYAGIPSYVFLPRDCPGLIVSECLRYGARTHIVEGLIHDAGKIVQEGAENGFWHNVGTLQEHGRVEGKKTMGLELAEQLGWTLPDVIIYPTGGGSGIIGMWLAFQQLQQLGFVTGPLPRLVSVQEKGCHPLVDALDSSTIKVKFSPQDTKITSSPTGMRVPHPPDGQMLINILQQTNGKAVAVSKEDITVAQLKMGSQGISSSPEGAATWAGMIKLIDEGYIQQDDEVVLFNTAHALKYTPYSTPAIPLVRSFTDVNLLEN